VVQMMMRHTAWWKLCSQLQESEVLPLHFL
jgi:hypothetical protein